MWVIARDDPEELLPEVLIDEDGSVMTFINRATAWKYIETLCYDSGVPFSFLDY